MAKEAGVNADLLSATLDAVAAAITATQDPWWIIGSAAALLVSLDGVQVTDVDLLTSEADALGLLKGWKSGPIKPTPSDLFRSTIFGKITATPLPIEIMASFCVRSGDEWRRIEPMTRIEVRWRETKLYVPAAGEQAAICRCLGRPKDLARAARLERLVDGAPASA